MTLEPVRIAVAGAGAIGLRHIEEIGASGSARLASIVDTAPAATATAQREGVPLFASLADLLAQERPDGIILATPNRFHVEQALQCVAAGIPTLVEKPVGHTHAEALRLCEAAERARVPILVGHHRRHSPILHKAVAVVQSGVLGKLVGVMGCALFYKPDAAGYFDGANAWRRQPGGGPVLLNMIHEVGNLRAMIGEIVQVQSFASSEVRGFPVEDTVAVNLRFANGALGTFLLSDTAASPKSWEQTSGENKAYAHYGDEDAYTIIGTDGSLAVPTMRLKTYARPQDRSWFNAFDERVEHVDREDPLARQIEHFVAVIRNEATPLVTCRDGLRNLRVTDAILEAASMGTTVDTR